MSFMGSKYYEDQDPVAVGYEDDTPYRGASTAAGSAIGSSIGAAGFAVPVAGPVLGPLLMGLGGAAGGFIGSLFEPDQPDVIYEDQIPVPRPYDEEPLPELPGTSYLKSVAAFGPDNSQAMAAYRSISEKYGVKSPDGFYPS